MSHSTTLVYPELENTPSSGVSVSASTPRVRYLFPDFIRGLTLCMMMCFHFLYDLNVLGWTQIDFHGNMFFVVWQKVRIFCFISIFGLCLREVYLKKFVWKRYIRRLLRLGLSAAAVSLATYMMFPSAWVYFGILHFAFVSSILGLAFIRIPKISLVLGLAILFCRYGVGWYASPLEQLYDMGHNAMDYDPLYPYFAYVLIGIFFHSIGIQKVNIPRTRAVCLFSFLGRHSLKIYLLHQPLFFGMLSAVSRFLAVGA